MNQTQMIYLENKFAVYLSEIDNLNHVDDFFSDASWFHSLLYFCQKDVKLTFCNFLYLTKGSILVKDELP